MRSSSPPPPPRDAHAPCLSGAFASELSGVSCVFSHPRVAHRRPGRGPRRATLQEDRDRFLSGRPESKPQGPRHALGRPPRRRSLIARNRDQRSRRPALVPGAHPRCVEVARGHRARGKSLRDHPEREPPGLHLPRGRPARGSPGLRRETAPGRGAPRRHFPEGRVVSDSRRQARRPRRPARRLDLRSRAARCRHRARRDRQSRPALQDRSQDLCDHRPHRGQDHRRQNPG